MKIHETVDIEHFPIDQAVELTRLLDTMTLNLLDANHVLETLEHVAPELTIVVRNQELDRDLSLFADRLAQIAAIAEFHVEDAIS